MSVPATKAQAPKTIRALLETEDFKNQVAKALPRHLTPDRFIRTAVTAMTKTPLLAQCTQASFFNALLTLSQLGLEPDGRRAHLIPFKNNAKGTVECQLIVDYKGLVELVMNTGQVSRIHADVVCEQDIFEYDRGSIAKHQINFKQPRGEAYAAYALIQFKDGTDKCEVMTKEEVEAVRKRSRAGSSGPWVTDWNEMAKKTVFRRASKWVKLSPEQRDIIESDDDQYQFSQAATTSTAAELTNRLEKVKHLAHEVIEEAEQADEAVPESRIQTLLDMILAATDMKGLDTVWEEVTTAAAQFDPPITDEEGQELLKARDAKKKAMAKGKK